jgi:putative oxidoreductase
MKKLFSVSYSPTALDLGIFLLRVTIGVLMAFYGWHKLTQFTEMAKSEFWEKQVNFLSMGGSISLGLTIFAEFFCSILLIVGLFTRLSLIPLLICMGFIVVVLDKYQIVSSGENGFELNHAFFYFILYFVLFLTGPGKWSLDRLISK